MVPACRQAGWKHVTDPCVPPTRLSVGAGSQSQPAAFPHPRAGRLLPWRGTPWRLRLCRPAVPGGPGCPHGTWGAGRGRGRRLAT